MTLVLMKVSLDQDSHLTSRQRTIHRVFADLVSSALITIYGTIVNKASAV